MPFRISRYLKLLIVEDGLTIFCRINYIFADDSDLLNRCRENMSLFIFICTFDLHYFRHIHNELDLKIY